MNQTYRTSPPSQLGLTGTHRQAEVRAVCFLLGEGAWEGVVCKSPLA